VGRGILIASIPFDVKELVLLDILPRKRLAWAHHPDSCVTDHHLKNQDPSPANAKQYEATLKKALLGYYP
jgi:hypothetical protein